VIYKIIHLDRSFDDSILTPDNFIIKNGIRFYRMEHDSPSFTLQRPPTVYSDEIASAVSYNPLTVYFAAIFNVSNVLAIMKKRSY